MAIAAPPGTFPEHPSGLSRRRGAYLTAGSAPTIKRHGMTRDRPPGPNPAIEHMDDAELLAHLIRVLRDPPPDSVLDAIERAVDGPTAH